MKQRVSWLFTISLVATDALMAGLAFAIAYFLRLQSEYENIAPFSDYWGMMLIHVMTVIVVFFFYRLYHRQRATSHIDEFYAIFGAASVGRNSSTAKSISMERSSGQPMSRQVS